MFVVIHKQNEKIAKRSIFVQKDPPKMPPKVINMAATVLVGFSRSSLFSFLPHLESDFRVYVTAS